MTLVQVHVPHSTEPPTTLLARVLPCRCLPAPAAGADSAVSRDAAASPLRVDDVVDDDRSGERQPDGERRDDARANQQVSYC